MAIIAWEIGPFPKVRLRITSYNVCYTKLLRQVKSLVAVHVAGKCWRRKAGAVAVDRLVLAVEFILHSYNFV